MTFLQVLYITFTETRYLDQIPNLKRIAHIEIKFTLIQNKRLRIKFLYIHLYSDFI